MPEQMKTTQPLSEAAIIEGVREDVASVSGRDLKDVSLDDDLFDLGILQSITLVALVVNIEKRFNFHLSIGDYNPVNFKSLRSLVQTVRRQAVQRKKSIIP